jgi:hypothetical protein
MLFGETVAVYCENHTEHTDTVRTSQEPYGTHRYSPYLTGNTLHLRYRAQPVNAVWGNSRCLLENHMEHSDTLCGQNAEFSIC